MFSWILKRISLFVALEDLTSTRSCTLSFFSSTPFTCSLTLFYLQLFSSWSGCIERFTPNRVMHNLQSYRERRRKNVLPRHLWPNTEVSLKKAYSLHHHISYWTIGSGNTFFELRWIATFAVISNLDFNFISRSPVSFFITID